MEFSFQSLVNLAVAPGIVLLVLSSAFRYQTLENQVSRLTAVSDGSNLAVITALRQRAGRFRAAFVALYFALVIIFAAALVCALTRDEYPVATYLLPVALIFVLYALLQLLLEARHSVSTLVNDIDQLSVRTPGVPIDPWTPGDGSRH